MLSRIPFRLITQERVRCEQVEITASWPIHLHHHSQVLARKNWQRRARLWKLFSGGKSPSTLSRHHVTSQVWIGSWMVNYFPWHALTIFEGTTTVSNTWTWRKPDRRMRCLWKMFTSFGFLFLSSTTLRTTRRQRCQTFRTKSFLFLHLHLMTGKRGHRVDPYQRRRICEEFGWKCWGNQHLWRRVQQDHLWASLHKDV